MKKVILVAAVSMMALASCKKDYVCECTTTDSSGLIDDLTVESTLENVSKSDAETACSQTVTAGTLSTTCELK